MLGARAKAASRDERDAWKRLQIDATAAGVLTSGAVGLAAAALGATAVVASPPLLVAGAMAWWAQRKLVTVERKVEDPPRLDFGESTLVSPHPVHPEAFGSDPLEQIALQFLRDLSAETALEDAMVVADERRQGAELLGRTDAAATHAAEVEGLIESLWVRADALAGIGRELGRRLRVHPFREADLPWSEVAVAGRFIDALPEDVQARLFRVGVDVGWFLDDVRVPEGSMQDPLTRFADALEEATRSTLNFARIAREEIRERVETTTPPDGPRSPVTPRRASRRRATPGDDKAGN